MNPVSTALRAAFPAQAQADMSEGEILTRAREAYIGTHWTPRWLRRAIRAGWCDRRLRAIVAALRDLHRPMHLIVAERDEATCALVMRTTPGVMALGGDERAVVADAVMTAVRIGRRG